MSSRSDLLAARRAFLRARSDRLRREFSADASAMALRLRIVDQVAALGRSGLVRALIGAGAAMLIFGRTRRILGIASRLIVLYPLVSRIVGSLRRRGNTRNGEASRQP